MNRFRTRLIIAATAAVLAAPLAASPASAIPVAGNGCNSNSGVQATTIGWFPAAPGTMSALRVACTFNNQPAGPTQVSPSFTIHDTSVAQYHNGAGRTVTSTGGTANNSPTIVLNAANNGVAGLPVAPAQLNRVITGPGIAPRTFVRSMTGSTVTLSKNTVAVTVGVQTYNLENSQVRSVDDATGAGVNILNSASANFTAADTGRSIAGTGIAPNTTITFVNATQVTLSNNYEAPGVALLGPVVTIGGSEITTTARRINGANIDGAAVIKSATNTALWGATDVGLRVTGFCLNGLAPTTTVPANVFILALGGGSPNPAHNVTTTANLTTGGAGFVVVGNTECSISVGQASATAPADGAVVAQQGVMLNLNPGFVAGSDQCLNEQPEGFGVVGQWYNPDNFQGTGLTNLQPGEPGSLVVVPPTKAIGQIYVATSAATYSAFVVERRAVAVLPPGEFEPAVHYDIVFPFAPTGIAMCAGTVNSPGLGFSLSINATTSGQSQLATGTGRPGTGQLRAIKPSASGGYTTTASVSSDSATIFFAPVGPPGVGNFNRTCVYPVGLPNPISMQCGAG